MLQSNALAANNLGCHAFERSQQEGLEHHATFELAILQLGGHEGHHRLLFSVAGINKSNVVVHLVPAAKVCRLTHGATSEALRLINSCVAVVVPLLE